MPHPRSAGDAVLGVANSEYEQKCSNDGDDIAVDTSAESGAPAVTATKLESHAEVVNTTAWIASTAERAAAVSDAERRVAGASAAITRAPPATVAAAAADTASKVVVGADTMSVSVAAEGASAAADDSAAANSATSTVPLDVADEGNDNGERGAVKLLSAARFTLSCLRAHGCF